MSRTTYASSKFSSLTDDQVRAILNPMDVYNKRAWHEAYALSLVTTDESGPRLDDLGKAVVAHAQAIADDLSAVMAFTLRKACGVSGWAWAPQKRTAMALAKRGLVKINPEPVVGTEMAALPCGRLVLALHEKTREEIWAPRGA